jgi:dCMP deaminase
MSDKWDKRYLALAEQVAGWSKDPSTQVGAVAVNDQGNVVAQGYNGFPRGIEDTELRYNDRELKYKYVVHAETNCIYNAAFNGNSLDGCTMYVWPLPVCHECAKAIIQSGVCRVVSPQFTNSETELRWKDSCSQTLDMFEEAYIQYDFI